MPSFVQPAEPDGGREEWGEGGAKGRRGEEAEIEGTSAVGAQKLCESLRKVTWRTGTKRQGYRLLEEGRKEGGMEGGKEGWRGGLLHTEFSSSSSEC